MVQPCENQKQDWPLSQESVPLVHRQLYGSIQPVFGCLPADHAGSAASMALRVGGMMRDAWPCTALVASSSIRFLIRSTDRHQAQMSRRGAACALLLALRGRAPGLSFGCKERARSARRSLWPSHQQIDGLRGRKAVGENGKLERRTPEPQHPTQPPQAQISSRRN
jgi:hypothetical protein